MATGTVKSRHIHINTVRVAGFDAEVSDTCSEFCSRLDMPRILQ